MTYDDGYAEYKRLCAQWDWPCCDPPCIRDAYDDERTPLEALRAEMEAK